MNTRNELFLLLERVLPTASRPQITRLIELLADLRGEDPPTKFHVHKRGVLKFATVCGQVIGDPARPIVLTEEATGGVLCAECHGTLRRP